MNLAEYDYIVFDCDGVILDSNKVKSRAFYEVAAPYGKDHAQELYDYHEKTQGISRYVKFKYFFEEILHRNDYQKEYEKCLVEYGKLTRERVFAAPFTEGFEEFLKLCPKKLFVISGTPEVEVQKILHHKGLSDRFDMILGSPQTKYENLERIFEKHDLGKGLFIGDGKIDYESSHHYGLDFLFLSKYSDMKDHEDFFKNKEVFHHPTFSDLLFSL